jgi:hypothetical protein
MIAKCGGHAIDHLLAIRWRDRTFVRGIRRGGSAGNATAAGRGGISASRVEQLRALPPMASPASMGPTCFPTMLTSVHRRPSPSANCANTIRANVGEPPRAGSSS